MDTIGISAVLFIPVESGVLLLTNPEQCRCVTKTASYIIQKESLDADCFTLEGSRSRNINYIHASMRCLGSDGFEMIVNQNASGRAPSTPHARLGAVEGSLSRLRDFDITTWVVAARLGAEEGSLSRLRDFDITTWVVAARLGAVEGSLSRRRDFDITAWVAVAWRMEARSKYYPGPDWERWKAAYPGGVTLISRPGLRLLCLPLQRACAM